MTLIELMIALAVYFAGGGVFYYLGKCSRRDQTRNAEAKLSDARETILYLESLAAKGMKRNRRKDESTESFVREYIVRLESAGAIEGEHHA